MRQSVKRWIRLGLGWLFIVLGILGLFLPILQGILFLAIGLVLLAGESPAAGRLVEYLRKRYPKFGTVLDGATAQVQRLVSRTSSGS